MAAIDGSLRVKIPSPSIEELDFFFADWSLDDEVVLIDAAPVPAVLPECCEELVQVRDRVEALSSEVELDVALSWKGRKDDGAESLDGGPNCALWSIGLVLGDSC